MNTGLRRLLCAVAALLAVVSCSTPAPDSAPARPDASPGALLGTPADLVSTYAVQQVSSRSLRIRYQSTSGLDKKPTVVSGTLFVPRGDPPPGGWPVASLGHATAGLQSSCGPSAYPALMGNAGIIATFLTFGYLVVMTDYQGLGTPGPHPYLEPKSAAYNVIDAVRAARLTVRETSDAWIGYGVSQGGQAVWAANEVVGEYAPELRLVGTISVAPPTDLTPLVDAMVDGTLTDDQRSMIPTILLGLQVAHPELRLSDYLHGDVLRQADVFAGCLSDVALLRGRIAERASADDFKPSTPAAAQQLRDWIGQYTVPSSVSAAPMLVAYGDADQLVLPQWTADGVQRACGFGDVVDVIVAPGQGHGILDLGSAPAEWTRARFAGEPAPNICVPAQ